MVQGNPHLGYIPEHFIKRFDKKFKDIQGKLLRCVSGWLETLKRTLNLHRFTKFRTFKAGLTIKKQSRELPHNHVWVEGDIP